MENYDKSRQHIKKQRHHFADKDPSSQSYGFSSGQVWMWELDCEESWALKNWCFWTVMFRLLRVPWTAWRSNESILKEINSEYSLEGLILRLKYFGHLMQRTNSLEKTLLLGKTESKRRVGNRGDVGWHHWLNGPESEQSQGDSEGQESLACCSSLDPKELDIT